MDDLVVVHPLAPSLFLRLSMPFSPSLFGALWLLVPCQKGVGILLMTVRH